MNPSRPSPSFARHYRKLKEFSDSEQILFLKQMFKNPRSLGAIAPSSKRLAKLICKNVTFDPHSDYILELGAGTGRFTEQLLASGIPEDRLIVVELEDELCHFLRNKFKNVTILHGSACVLKSLLPPQAIGHIGSIVSGIPLMNCSVETRESIVHNCFSVMKKGGNLLQFTYGALSPLSNNHLSKRCVGRILRNIPPATVWEYKIRH